MFLVVVASFFLSLRLSAPSLVFSFSFPGFLCPLCFIAAFCLVLYMAVPCVYFSLVFPCDSPTVLLFLFSVAQLMFFLLRLLFPAVAFHANIIGLRLPSRFPYLCPAPSSISGGCVPFLLSDVFLVYLLLLHIASVIRRIFCLFTFWFSSYSYSGSPGFVRLAAPFLALLPPLSQLSSRVGYSG